MTESVLVIEIQYPWVQYWMHTATVYIHALAVIWVPLYCPPPPPLAKAGTLKLIRPSVRPTKTLTWFIFSEVLMIGHWYLACLILVTSPFNWHHAVTLTSFKQGQSCCWSGDHNSPNLLCYYCTLYSVLCITYQRLICHVMTAHLILFVFKIEYKQGK